MAAMRGFPFPKVFLESSLVAISAMGDVFAAFWAAQKFPLPGTAIMMF
jgi:hypothetical protein